MTTPAGTVDPGWTQSNRAFTTSCSPGDWTHSGIDGGCVEAAVISGERAAAV